MAKARALDKRRKSIRNIRKITRTMELISTARFKQGDGPRGGGLRLYAGASPPWSATSPTAAWRSPIRCWQPRPEPRQAVLLVLTANRGLCGGYKAASCGWPTPATVSCGRPWPRRRLEVSGKRGISAFRFRKIQLAERFTHFDDKPSFAEVEAAGQSLSGGLSRPGRLDRLDVAYTKFESLSRQYAVVETLLPLAAPGGRRRRTTTRQHERQYEFLPSAASIVDEVVPASFKVQALQVFPRRGRERADRPHGGHEERHGERRRDDRPACRWPTTAPGRGRSPGNCWRSSAGPRR